MALSRIPNTLIRGFQTSDNGAVGHHRVAIRINNAIDVFDALNADKTRSRAEKAPLFKQLQTQHGEAIRKDMDRFHRELLARADHHAAQAEKVLNSIDMAAAVQIAVGLKSAGLSSDQVLEAVHNSREIAIALARVPTVLSGMSTAVAVKAAMKHHPELVEAEAELQRDLDAYKSIERVASNTILQLGMSVDELALAERFNPEALNPTPEPKTVAQEQAQMAKVVDPAFEQATNEQIAEHVGIYGYAHAK